MAIKYPLNSENLQQAAGPNPTASRVRLMALRLDKPHNFEDMEGHQLANAPEYTEIPAERIQQHRRVNGVGITEMVTISEVEVEMVTRTLSLPEQYITMAQRIRDAQNRAKAIYHMALVQGDTCNPCTSYFEVARQATLGFVRKTSAERLNRSSNGGDGNSAAVAREVTISSTGEDLIYHGLTAKTLQTGLDALYAIAELPIACATGDCPAQGFVIAGGDGVAVPLVQYTQNQFEGLTAIDTSALTAGDVVRAVLVDGSTIWLGLDNGADGGGLASSVAKAAAAAVTGPTVNINVILRAGGRLLAMGHGGEIWSLCDGESTWTQISHTVTTDAITSAAYDRGTVYIGAGTALYKLVGDTLAEVTALSLSSAVQDVAVIAPGYVQVATADGNIYRGYVTAGQWYAEQVTSSAVVGLLGDGYGMRTLAASGTTLYEASPLTATQTQGFGVIRDELGSADFATTGDVTAAVIGSDLAYYGLNLAFFVTDGGEVVRVGSCYPCGDGC